MESTIVPFVKKSTEINDLLLALLGKRLYLPEDALSKRHRLDERSASETRCIKKPPTFGAARETNPAIGAHTDFGSLVSEVGASTMTRADDCISLSCIIDLVGCR